MEQSVRVGLVEDHGLMLEGLVAVLSADPRFEVVGTATSLAEFKTRASLWVAGVIVTDYALPDGTGAEVARHVRSVAPGTAVLTISGVGRPTFLEEAIEAGCAGFVSKVLGSTELADAIMTVARGASVFPVGALRQLASPDLTRPGATITHREMEVLRLLASARSAPEIAELLSVSTHTARNHIRSVLTKLGARSQLDAVVMAVRSGLVAIEP